MCLREREREREREKSLNISPRHQSHTKACVFEGKEGKNRKGRK